MTDWQPGARPEMLRERARLNADIRSFFAARGVLEVETPLLCATTATDLHLASFAVTDFSGQGGAGKYLQTSPEFAMKRLLAAGSGPVYQLGKAFRAGDFGTRHNPEFTLLEWYRPGYTLAQLMDEAAALLQATLSGTAGMPAFADCEQTTYRALFEARFGINPHASTPAMLRERVASETSYGDATGLDAVACLDLLFADGIEPGLGHARPVFVQGFPLAQAALAQVETDAAGDRVAARCEVYVRGTELANAYRELTDPVEQRRRFQADNVARRDRGLPEIPVDERLLAAMVHGLPDCAGIALGVDRLLMLRAGAASLDAVLAFASPRA